MKKINDDILKYLSGLMSPERKEQFEKEIVDSNELEEELKSVQGKLYNLNSVKETVLDERYFNNLIPNVYSKLERKKPKIYKSIYYAVPIAASIIVFFLLYPAQNGSYELQIQNITEEVVNNLDNEDVAEIILSDYSLENSIAYSSSQLNSLDTGLPEEINFSNGDLTNMIDMAMLDYSKSTFLSSNDLENIYQKIK